MKLNLDFYVSNEENKISNEEMNIIEKYFNVERNGEVEDLLTTEASYNEIKTLSNNRKNIIDFYPIEKNDTVLEINSGFGEITGAFLNKSKKVVAIESKKEKAEAIAKRYSNYDNLEIYAGDYEKINLNEKFDYVSLIGISNLKKDFYRYLDYAKKMIKEDGKIIIVIDNKFGIKYFSGIKQDKEMGQFDTIAYNDQYIDVEEIEKYLEENNYKTKKYYPMPDYIFTNAIYTDDFLPNIDHVASRNLECFDIDNEYVKFFERDVLKEFVKRDKNIFKFLNNSFLLIVSKKTIDDGIKAVTFGTFRKPEFRIKTVINNDKVFKVANDIKAKEHIMRVKDNIQLLNKYGINTLDSFENSFIISKYVKNAKTLDKIIIDSFAVGNIDEAINNIIEFKDKVLNKLEKSENVKNNVFNKYNIICNDKELMGLTFVKDGLFDLTPQNCFVINNDFFVYDQEWYEENVPIEFILFRSIIVLLSEIRLYISKEELFEKLKLTPYVKMFYELEEKIQNELKNEVFWNLHVKSIKTILQNLQNKKSIKDVYEEMELKEKYYNIELENKEKEKEKIISIEKEKIIISEEEKYRKIIHDKDVHIRNLEAIIASYSEKITNYESQLAMISNSLSWKITKPLRYISWILTPDKNVGFMERILPGGSKMRIKYDIKMAKKKEEKKLKGYENATDEKTVEYWKGIEHRESLKRERIQERINNGEILSNYEYWQLANDPTMEELEKQERTKFRKRPKISITIPLYNTDSDFFRELIFNLHRQTYKNWELCLADGSKEKLVEIESMCKDKRIKYKFLNGNLGIAGNTNEALKMATGDYITLLDHDDLLPINALYEIVKCINENPDVDFIYTDEDKFQNIDEFRYEPHFKPDYAPDTLRANNYICHYSVFRKDLLNKIGLFNSNYDGAQDFDIILRATENAKKIIHIPKILYHWRVHKNSTAMAAEAKPYAFESGIHAVEAHLERVGLKGKVSHGATLGTYKVDYEVIGNPKVSIIIPNKDGKDILKVCVDSILSKTTYKNYEIIIVENNSETKEIFEYYKELEKNNKIKVVTHKETGFNYSAIINFGVKNASGDYIIQLNNDTELRTEDWIEKMLGFCQRDDVGAVGVKMYYPDNTLQHAGIIVGALKVAAHVFRGVPDYTHGYFGRDSIIQNMNAVTAACIMTKKSIYEEVGFMNEKFAVAFNDIDFCLKIRETGKLIVYNPFVEFTHFESKTRGNDLVPEKIERFKKEIDLFITTWEKKLLEGDEYYNKNFSLDSDQYEIRKDKVSL